MPAGPLGFQLGPQLLRPLLLAPEGLSEGELLDLRGLQAPLHAIDLPQLGLWPSP